MPYKYYYYCIFLYEYTHKKCIYSFFFVEYRAVVIALRKPNILTRHDMETGNLYNEIPLGRVVMKNLSWNSSLDQLILSSSKYKNSRDECAVAFKVFSLHPFSHMASISISANLFPGKSIIFVFFSCNFFASEPVIFLYILNLSVSFSLSCISSFLFSTFILAFQKYKHFIILCELYSWFCYWKEIFFLGEECRSKYGLFRNAEIDGSFLLVMTTKSFTLIYNAEEMLKVTYLFIHKRFVYDFYSDYLIFLHFVW